MATKRALIITFLAAALTLLWAGAAGAQENPDYTAPAPVVEVTAPPIQTVVDTPVSRTSTPSLAITGADVFQFVLVGGALVAGGAGVLAVRRRAAV